MPVRRGPTQQGGREPLPNWHVAAAAPATRRVLGADRASPLRGRAAQAQEDARGSEVARRGP
eukprot:8086764-Pyramimonas_sp.AAC.1